MSPLRYPVLWLFCGLLLLSWAWLPIHAHSNRRIVENRHAAGLATRASAGLSPDDERQFFHWPRLPVRVFLVAESEVEKHWARVATAGFDEWTRATGGVVRYRLVSLPSQAQITVRFAPGQTVPGHPDLVGITNTVWTGPVLESAEIVLAVGQRTPVDLQTVAAHEFGHALGIRGHSADPADLMFPALHRLRPERGTFPPPESSITEHDLDSLTQCYPALLTPSPARWDTPG